MKPVLPWRFILAIGHGRDATSSRELEVKADALEPEDDQPRQVTHRPLELSVGADKPPCGNKKN